ncbi:LysM peptidoglycan-binding domain-containing protein [Flavobacterium frigidarium]|uniref:PBP1 and LysM peptidoglycan-binding domain-containing protein n=1 Tax=Flavobacterium frigidarium TaxID=99286 RepID=UPI0030DBAC6B|tara:strand:+ start:83 stop:2098 length:2016 start_codon:yes stop_codon:yes gene_type:complete
MKYFFATCATFLFLTGSVFSQTKTLTHKVEKGETITQIAQKYQVTPFDIYQLNPDAQTGLRADSVLLIPANSDGKSILTSSKSATVSTAASAAVAGTTHLVMPKETLYGIKKQYNVSEQALIEANPEILVDGLKIGMLLKIPSKGAVKDDVKVTTRKQEKAIKKAEETAVYHDVLPKETKYSISRQYGITIEQLEKLNPEVVTNLPIGYKLLIKGKRSAVIDSKVITAPTDVYKEVKTNAVVKDSVPQYIAYEVQPKETLYSLSKMFDISQRELLELNPELNAGVTIGMFIKAPTKNYVTAVEGKKEYVSLNKNIASGKRKRLAMLLPFNVSAADEDVNASGYSRLKKDKFLNMTLDFYAGALIAIDSAKTLGLPIDVEIYDSEETKNSSNVLALIKANNLQTANAIVGPFYQSNAEVAAQALVENNVPVVSPLSKDVGNAFPNLYQSIPNNETVKNTMFNYMRSQNGNIMAVVDKKKESILSYLREYQPGVPLVEFKDNGSVSAESLKGMLVKGRMNYVVMETANTWMIKTTISAMLSSMSSYQVQLVILEPNETLDFEEIKFTNLTKLKLMYPSVTRDNVSPEAAIFDKNYKKINNVYPSDYATRGFDVTFDTMMRLVQNVKFEQTIKTVATDRIENKFEYYKKNDGGYTNKGVHIMYYDTDLIIKEAK